MIDEKNYLILKTRYEQHMAGLEMASQVCVDRFGYHGLAAQRVTDRPVGVVPGCIGPSEDKILSFLDEMKRIEEEFMSGARKLSHNDN